MRKDTQKPEGHEPPVAGPDNAAQPVPGDGAPLAQGAAPADDDDDKAITFNGVGFSKVQNRDVFMAYDAADDHVATVRKPKAAKRWAVEIVDSESIVAISFSSSVAARAFVLGYFARTVA